MARYKYSDEDLIKIIQNKAKELGRTPTRRDVKQFDVISKRFGSWNNALVKAGFVPNWNTAKLTQEDCIKLIRKKAKQLGRTPYAREWSEDKTLPSIDKVRKIFDNKSWFEIVQIAGLEPIHTDLRYKGTHLFNRLSDKEVLRRLKSELERLNTSNQNVYELNKSKFMPSAKYFFNRFNTNSWNDILLMLGYSKDQLYIKEYNNEELIRALQDYYKDTGLNPTVSAMEKLGYSHKTFSAHFGSFNNALIAAGLDINQEQTTVTHTDDELLQMYKELCTKLGRAATSNEINEYLPYKYDVFALRFGGLQNLRVLAGFNDGKTQVKKYTKKEIENKLIKQYKMYNRRLTNKELSQLSQQDGNFPSITTICRYFRTTKMSEVWEYIELKM